MVADIEKLPFDNESFDVVTCAGSLSYGDAKLVDSEIYRVIKPGGFFICVDSLNCNPLYWLNRYVHYLRGLRSKMTLINMPTLKRINLFSEKYKEINIKYFGSITFLMPIISEFFGDKMAYSFSNYIDKIINVKKTAFKFTMVAKKNEK